MLQERVAWLRRQFDDMVDMLLMYPQEDVSHLGAAQTIPAGVAAAATAALRPMPRPAARALHAAPAAPRPPAPAETAAASHNLPGLRPSALLPAKHTPRMNAPRAQPAMSGMGSVASAPQPPLVQRGGGAPCGEYATQEWGENAAPNTGPRWLAAKEEPVSQKPVKRPAAKGLAGACLRQSNMPQGPKVDREAAHTHAAVPVTKASKVQAGSAANDRHAQGLRGARLQEPVHRSGSWQEDEAESSAAAGR